MRTVQALWLLVFSPDRFVERVVGEVVDEDSREHPQVLQQHSGVYPADRRAGILESVTSQTIRLRSALVGGILVTAVTIVLGGLAGTFLNWFGGSPAKAVVYGFQAIGAAVILGATLGEVGSDIRTWKGNTIPERLNRQIFRALYVAGTFLFVMSVAWDAT